MTDPAVKLGSMLFTLVEPHREHVVAYNRWYERDHFYAGCMVGPGILAGRRWVATKPYKAMRALAGDEIAPDAMTGSYLATYFVEQSLSREWGTWAAEEVHRLHAAGRMFEQRDHVHTQVYVYRWGAFRDADGVPPELALDHPFRGLVAVIGAAPEREASNEWFRSSLMPSMLRGSVVMCLAFTPVPVPDSAPADVPRANAGRDRFLHLYFLDEDPARVWDDHFGSIADDYAASGDARALWISPFIPTIPGTDTYTDQLW